jgi:hypothetical protein
MSRRKRAAGRHASRSWICDCGRTLNGNGGISSHRRACPAWKKRVLERSRKALAEIESMKPEDSLYRYQQDRLPSLRRQIAQLEVDLGVT